MPGTKLEDEKWNLRIHFLRAEDSINGSFSAGKTIGYRQEGFCHHLSVVSIAYIPGIYLYIYMYMWP